MKIAFCNPPSPDGKIYIRDINRSGRASSELTIWPQVSLAMMASMFPEDEVVIWDCIAENLGYDDVYEKLENFRPDWFITTPISSIFKEDMRVVFYAKVFKAKTVIVSPHAQANPEIKKDYPELDYVLNYDGKMEIEYELRNLIKQDVRDHYGIEDLPITRQRLLPLEKYDLPIIGKGYTFVVISRGCPYGCIYCRQQVTNRGRVRYRPVDKVIEEIKVNDLKNIALHSDTATLNKEWMHEFCEKLPSDVRWICNSRVDTVDYELLCAMRKAGCWMVCFGIESGNDEILKLNKKGATVADAWEACILAKMAGLKVWGYFMLGLYGDNHQTMLQTVDLACKLPIDLANFSISAPYPGTVWNKICEENKWLIPGTVFDQNYSAQVDQPTATAKMVKEMQRYAYRKWYLSWRGIKFFFQFFNVAYLKSYFKLLKNHLWS